MAIIVYLSQNSLNGQLHNEDSYVFTHAIMPDLWDFFMKGIIR